MSVAPKVLVTGANGFIGEALVPMLDKAGFYVIAGTRDGKPVIGASEGLAIGDMSDREWSSPDLSKVDLVIHLAAIAHRTGVDRESYQQVNAQVPSHLANAAAIAACDRFIFLSTAKVLGDISPADSAFTDNTSSNPPDYYSKAKLIAEDQIEMVAAGGQMATISLRPPLVHGPKPSGNLAKLIQVINQGGVTGLRLPLPLGSTENHRSLISRESLCQAIVAAAKHPTPKSGRYLVADGPSISTTEIMHALADGLSKKAPLISFPPSVLGWALRLLGKAGLADRLLGDFVVESDGFQRDYGWVPNTDTITALKSMAAAQAQDLQN